MIGHRKQTVAPLTEPITLTEAKLHLRVDDTADDDLITALIQAAREYLETACNRQFVSATWEWVLDTINTDELIVPISPLSSVTSIEYYDTDDDLQTISTDVYAYDTHSDPGRIYLKEDQIWPTDIRGNINDVTITLVAGYGAAAAVPESIKAAVKLAVADLYTLREPSLTGTTLAENKTLDRLIWANRMAEFPS